MAHSNGDSTPRDQTPCELIEEDRISSLPWHILNMILCLLPLLDAVKTSALSKDWRYKWLSLSEFNLDSCTLFSGKNAANHRWEIVTSIVNRFLRHHSGPIRKFNLRTYFSSHNPEICHWLQYLSNKTVEELSIRESGRTSSNDDSTRTKIPSYLFSFRNLYKLRLTGCTLRIPSDFTGFTSLHTVFFRDVRVNGQSLSRFIYSCYNLATLTLFNLWEVDNLKICAPRLNWLITDTSVGDIVIVAAPFLVKVAVVDVRIPSQHGMPFNFHGAFRSLIGQGSIKQLVISGFMVKHLAVDYGFGYFPWRNTALTSLMVGGLGFQTINDFNFCFSMLNSCPNVRNFLFTLRSAKGKRLFVEHLQQLWGTLSFPGLRRLELRCLAKVGMGCSINFIEYIAAHSPNLQYLTVLKQGGTGMHPTRVSRMLTRLRAARPQAIVRYVYAGPRYVLT